MKQISILPLLGLVLLIISSFHLYYQFHKPHSVQTSKAHTAKPVSEDKYQTARIAAIGDVMMHTPQIKSGYHGNGRYDFRPFFKEIKPYLSASDICIANLELTLAGRKYPYSGYPRFNAPDQTVKALKYAGVDVVSTANNHAMDTGIVGLRRTYEIVNLGGIKTTGTAPSADKRKAVIMKAKGITFAFLAYTESSNGIPIPQTKPYLLNYMDPQQMNQDIKEVRRRGVDIVFVSLHFGSEYQRKPNSFQIRAARNVLKNGADVVLGSHPHVLQPVEKLHMNGKDKYIIYSLGNFISNQRGPHTDEGVILYFDIMKDVKKNVTKIQKVSFLPTFVHRYKKRNNNQYVIIPTESKNPDILPKYPGISLLKWNRTFDSTLKQIKTNNSFPVFYLH